MKAFIHRIGIDFLCLSAGFIIGQVGCMVAHGLHRAFTPNPFHLKLPSEEQLLRNRIKHPGYGWCGRCGRTWDVVNEHETPINGSVTKFTVVTGANDGYFLYVSGVPADGKPHTVFITNGESCFPLCEQCWQELKTPEARLPYYRMLLNEWTNDDPEAESKWAGMKQSVLEGK